MNTNLDNYPDDNLGLMAIAAVLGDSVLADGFGEGIWMRLKI